LLTPANVEAINVEVSGCLPIGSRHRDPRHKIAAAQLITIDDHDRVGENTYTSREDCCPANLLTQGGYPQGDEAERQRLEAARHVRAFSWVGGSRLAVICER